MTLLNLGHNHIGNFGAASLSQALSVNTTLTYLNLEANCIGVYGAASLSQALLANSSSLDLYLNGQHIGDVLNVSRYDQDF